MTKPARGQAPLQLADQSYWALEGSQTTAVKVFIRWNTKFIKPFLKLWLGKCVYVPVWLGISLTSPLTKTDRSGGMAVFAGSDGSKEKPGVFPRSPLCSHKSRLVERLQQMENYAVYWDRHGHSLKSNSAGVSYPLGFPAFTFTCRDSPCPLFYLPKISGSQHRNPFLVPFLQQSWAGIAGGTGHFLHPIPIFSAQKMSWWW